MSKLTENHYCSLPYTSPSCLPKLPPTASWFRRFLRDFRKLMLVSHKNPKTKCIFKSAESIRMEQRRQINFFAWFVVHPFSVLGIIRQSIMCCTWLISFVVSIFLFAFRFQDNPMYVAMRYINAIFCAYIVSCFFFGIYQHTNHHVELDHKVFIRYYLKTYFIVDLLHAFPYGIFVSNEIAYLTLKMLANILIVVRSGTANRYFRTITLWLDIGQAIHELICVIIIGLFLLHWWTCIAYLIPKLVLTYTNYEGTHSWIIDAGISKYHNVSSATMYFRSMHQVMAHFFGCGTGVWTVRLSHECLMFSLFILSGIFYLGYITAVVLQLSKTYKMAESMYDKFISQLNLYMRSRNLPMTIRYKLRLYYENRFKKRFFRESAILDTLSEHLRHEIGLYNCRSFIESAWFFMNLPKSVVGHIIGTLQNLVVLPNDLIHNNAEPGDYMYFIARGSVAIILEDGTEALHVIEGDYFGELPFLMILANLWMPRNTSTARYIAIEITELFLLHKNVFNQYIGSHKPTIENLLKIANLRILTHQAAADRKTRDSFTGSLVNMNEDFLDKPMRRRAVETKRILGHLTS